MLIVTIFSNKQVMNKLMPCIVYSFQHRNEHCVWMYSHTVLSSYTSGSTLTCPFYILGYVQYIHVPCDTAHLFSSLCSVMVCSPLWFHSVLYLQCVFWKNQVKLCTKEFIENLLHPSTMFNVSHWNLSAVFV